MFPVCCYLSPVFNTLDQICPLFARELLEQSARRRTYVIRTVFGGLFFLSFLVLLWATTHGKGISMLGTGLELFKSVVTIQFMAIYLFLPALFFDAIAREREVGSLDLLLMAMPSHAVVSQKYFSRLLPAFNFLLIALPVYAICLLYGGLQIQEILQGIFYLVLTCFQVGAYALMISALCRSAMQALIAVYVGYAAVVVWTVCSYSLFGSSTADGLTLPLVFFGQWKTGDFYWTGIPLIGASLLLAERAVVYPDLVFRCIPKGLRKTRPRPKRPLPEDRPIRWIEQIQTIRFSPRRGLIFSGYMLIALGLPGVVYLATPYYNKKDNLVVLLVVAWGLVALRVGVRCLDAVIRERDSGTLGVLMTAPVSGRTFIEEKAWIIRWHRNIMLVAVACWLVVKIWFLLQPGGISWEGAGPRPPMAVALSCAKYALLTLLPVLIFVPLCGWTSFYIALCVRHRNRAVLTMLFVLIGWALFPLAGLVLFAEIMNIKDPLLLLLGMPSPLFTILLTEFPSGMQLRFGPLYRFAAMLSLPLFWMLMRYIRGCVLRRADEILYE
jgi:ABC-type transport system involved in multi-copper enzyme maturation permease subunit